MPDENKHVIGRAPRTGPLVRSFTVQWDAANKAPQISDEDDVNGPNNVELRMIRQHFQSPVTTLAGGEDSKGRCYDKRVTLQPGSVEHFNAACYQIPRPFLRMS